MCWDVNRTVNHSVQSGTWRSGGITPLILNRATSRPGRSTHSTGRWMCPTADMGFYLKTRSFALLNAEPRLLCGPAYNLVTVPATLRRRPLFAVNIRQLLQHECTADQTNSQAIRQALMNGTDIAKYV